MFACAHAGAIAMHASSDFPRVGKAKSEPMHSDIEHDWRCDLPGLE